ncbi:MAG TPA: D-aminoacyl-tRNA deacylase [Bacilli bacterium]|nr:D-aminoacyl-tRNA deacylase [Bacilli bacterium]
MRVIIQRSKESSVKVDNKIVGIIEKGLVILVGFTQNDTSKDIDYIIKKILGLRIFDDSNGVMNLSIKDVNGSILSISQFTLYADTTKGNRPSYINSMNRDEAIKLYDEFNNKLKEYIKVETGIFGADMEVNIINDGPVTIIIDSKDKI